MEKYKWSGGKAPRVRTCLSLDAGELSRPRVPSALHRKIFLYKLDCTKMELTEMLCEYMKWIRLAQDGVSMAILLLLEVRGLGSA